MTSVVKSACERELRPLPPVIGAAEVPCDRAAEMTEAPKPAAVARLKKSRRESSPDQSLPTRSEMRLSDISSPHRCWVTTPDVHDVGLHRQECNECRAASCAQFIPVPESGRSIDDNNQSAKWVTGRRWP